MNIRPRGPDGIQQRMREIQARLDSVFPRQEPRPAPVAPTPAQMPGLSGSIGAGDPGGNKPLSPFLPGMQRETSPAPIDIRAMIHAAAGEAKVDAGLFEALVACESSFNPLSKSDAGAMGLSQLMPGTAKALGVTNPYDPEQNLRGGAKYLSQMLTRFGGDQRLALAAYNAGPGAVERHRGIPPFTETQNYVRRVLARYEAQKSQ